ncbi:MAG: hypothetical protein EOP43_06720 [Sphingobacteriaceae bacterium]|nr:MAG: hypothetical protein EOP43_06720 [Sphingobacteriaceae bacterium]
MNKKITLLLFALICSITLKAQTQKGTHTLGGNIGFSTASGTTDYINFNNSIYNYSDKTKTNFFSIGPNYSFFIADNLDFGLSAGYSTQKMTYDYPVYSPATAVLIKEGKLQAVSGSVYLRKYFLYNGKIGIRTGPYAQYYYNKYQNLYTDLNTVNDNTQKGYTVNTGLILDLVYFPTRRIGVASNLGYLAYSHYDMKNDNQSFSNHDKSDSFGLGFSSALNLSVFYCF